MMRFKTIFFTGLCFFLLGGIANAAPILTEEFESDGLGTRYTAAGAGNGGGGCCQVWERNSLDGGGSTALLTGFQGADYWKADDLDDGGLPAGFSAATPRNLAMNTVNIASFSNIILTVSLSASTDLDAGEDFLRVIAIDNDTLVATVLDEFDGSTAGSNSGVTLGTAFQDISYNLSALGITNLNIVFEGWTTSNDEVLGIDNIRLTGDTAPIGAVAVPTLNNVLLILMSVLLLLLSSFAWRKNSHN